MKEIKTVQADEKNIGKMAKYVSTIINEVKDNDFVEGIFYIGSNLMRPTISLAIVSNDYRFDYKYPDEKREEIITNSGMDLKVETIQYWKYFFEQRKLERSDYPIEFMLRYGNILYDKQGKLATLKQQLETDTEIEPYLDYWLDACKFEPPLQLIKK
jgi:hypothetical protein